jgi:hypothetical protein
MSEEKTKLSGPDLSLGVEFSRIPDRTMLLGHAQGVGRSVFDPLAADIDVPNRRSWPGVAIRCSQSGPSARIMAIRPSLSMEPIMKSS